MTIVCPYIIPAAATVTNQMNPSHQSVDGTGVFDIPVSGGGLTVVHSSSDGWSTISAYDGRDSGKYYWEVKCNALGGGAQWLGVSDNAVGPAGWHGPLGQSSTDGLKHSVGYTTDGNIYINASIVRSIQAMTAGQTSAFALDIGNKKLHIKNLTSGSNWNNTGGDDPATNTGGIDISALTYPGVFFPSWGQYYNAGADSATFNFGASTFLGLVPANFTTWPGGPTSAPQGTSIPIADPNITSWNAQLSTITANATTAPDSTNTGTLVTVGAGVAGYVYKTGIAVPSGFSYLTGYLKHHSGPNWKFVDVADGAASPVIGTDIYLDLVNGVVGHTFLNTTTGNQCPVKTTLTAAPNGWYRFVLELWNPAASTATIHIYAGMDNDTAFPPATAACGVYVWGLGT